ncbi:centrosomal protein of 57 kDa isoform X2 [Callorhinchus milii]|uniref:Centrosomal protein 57 n=1 Tax=Callorhinchus milii TaxID=7868 RepID=A0A4W3IIA9_CALMI|nr:centrosomal protein of 57 kDa isoform X2 [Callorhinchus milii]|eukprot:gi/632937562/ref/XP_007900144.1/ PREDICTED: centrosomal protein of 57 kDa isoform X2 [Callorhinchus milii]
MSACHGSERLQDYLDESCQGQSSHNTSFIPSFTPYPMDKPFINADLRRCPDDPIFAYPETNSRAVLSALKNLQEKIRKLELERIQAEENMKRLSEETAEYKKVLDKEKRREGNMRTVSQHNQELSAQLASAESRCNLLEKQLEYMRHMVQNAEMNKTTVLQRQASLENRGCVSGLDLQARLEKLDLLEREYFKLTTTQTAAERKICVLEQKLREEEHQRKLVQDKAAQLQTGLETNRILLQAVSPTPPKIQKPKKKKKQPIKNACTNQFHAQPHYRLSLGDVPFVAGKSASPSHSVRANVQHVLHLLKQHNRILCNEQVVNEQPMVRFIECSKSNKMSQASSTVSSTLHEELCELLLTLQDEFGQMSFEHQELVKQIQEAQTDCIRDDLERELEALVKRMEAKGDQIAKVHKHQASLRKLKETRRKKQSASKGSSNKRTGNGSESEVKVTTTVTTRGKDAVGIKVRPGDKSRGSLRLLKDMQILQTTLQKDDVSWGY